MSRSHTNVTLPTRWDGTIAENLEKEKLKLEAKFWKEQFEYMCDEGENMVQAIEEWGYVDLKVGNERVRLVKGENR